MLNVQFLSMGFVHLSVLSTVIVLEFQTLLSLFSNHMLVFGAGIPKMVVRITKREDPDQTASEEAV